ncbi:MAG: GTPase Era [Deltaproteobacteria bacterium]|nr:GTPase Era [Deltaproteobacteria bacterium]MBW2723784.1 GTPase Era [Deltaproteobacteria bacterium]
MTGRDKEKAGAPYRAGFVAILGPPNAGKSTLMNRILGEKLAIVTAKPQTTRSRILGIHTTPGAQILFVDTPGLHEGGKLLNTALNEAVEDAARKCDVGVILVDLTRGWQDVHQQLREKLVQFKKPAIVVGTKCDLVGADKRVEVPDGDDQPVATLRVSGLTGEGSVEVEAAIVEQLPESPRLYEDDILTDRPVRWLAGEFVREAVFEYLGQELPYSMAVDVIKYKEDATDLVEIHANILVMRDSQKRIVVGKGGAMVKRIGIRARLQIEQLIGSRVHLRLFVKVDPKWLKSAKRIDALGYN